MGWHSGIADVHVNVKFADQALANKIRAWARRNGATVKLDQCTRGAYEGEVVIHSPWDEGVAVAHAKAEALRALLKGTT